MRVLFVRCEMCVSDACVCFFCDFAGTNMSIKPVLS